MVAVNNETLDKRLAGRVPEAISWDITAAALDLRRRDHLYAVHYPDPEHIGAYHRCFGGDIIQGAKGNCHSTAGILYNALHCGILHVLMLLRL